MDLESFLEASVVQERRPVPVDADLRLCAWGGMAAMALLDAWLILGRGVTSTRPRFFIFWFGTVRAMFLVGGHAAFLMALATLGLVAGGALAIWTGGFAWAPEWGLYAAFAIAMAGLIATLPILVTLVICILNLAVWILYGVVIAIVVISVVFAAATSR